MDDQHHPPTEPGADPTARIAPPPAGPWPPAGTVPPPAGPPPTVAGPRRRWTWIVAVVVLLAAAGTAGAIAWEQRSVAEEWRDRALAVEEQRDDAMGRGDAYQRQLEETLERLVTSEEDVGLLEERIRELAGEVAQAQDRATTVEIERDVFVELSSTVSSAVEALDGCVSRLFSLVNDSVAAYNAAAAGDFVDVDPLNAAADSTTRFCNDARQAAANAGAAADQLLSQ